MLTNAFENFQNIYFGIYEIDPFHTKNTKVTLDLLTDMKILLMIKKGIRGEICHAIYHYMKANDKCITIMIKSKNHKEL